METRCSQVCEAQRFDILSRLWHPSPKRNYISLQQAIWKVICAGPRTSKEGRCGSGHLNVSGSDSTDVSCLLQGLLCISDTRREPAQGQESPATQHNHGGELTHPTRCYLGLQLSGKLHASIKLQDETVEPTLNMWRKGFERLMESPGILETQAWKIEGEG